VPRALKVGGGGGGGGPNYHGTSGSPIKHGDPMSITLSVDPDRDCKGGRGVGGQPLNLASGRSWPLHSSRLNLTLSDSSLIFENNKLEAKVEEMEKKV
jgi:hypothetical protein